MAQLPLLPGCVTVFVSGPVASGKSWLLKQWVQSLERSVTLDIMAEYGGEGYEEIWGSPKQLADRLAENPHYYRIAYHPKNIPEDFHWAFCALWQLPQPRWFVIEEVHEVCGVNSIHEDMKTMLRYSRHNLMGIIASSQRIPEVNRLLTSVSRMNILFHTSESRDIESIALRYGHEVADAVSGLQRCIYNDVTKTLEQSPECVVHLSGIGWKVVSLGDTVKTNSGEEQWDEILVEARQKDEASSFQQDSGKKEQNSQEHSSATSSRNSRTGEAENSTTSHLSRPED
jgi:hypothetical protein